MRPISHRGFCLPCNMKRKYEGRRQIQSRDRHTCGETKIETLQPGLRSHDHKPFKFPFPSVRPSQKEMMDDVKIAVAEGRHLVADAPTGLGKTIAALFPSVEYAVANGKNVFFLTSRLSQHKAAIETLKLMKDGNGFSAVDIVGKKHLCSHDVSDMDNGMFSNFCSAMIKDKRCAYYKNARSSELAAERAGIMRILSGSIPSTEEAMKLASSRYCTYEMLMDAARHADVVVGDYFHLFGSSAQLKRMAKNLSDTIIIVDEAHNLSGRIRNHLSSKISTRTCDLAAREAQNFTEFEARSIIHEIDGVISAMGRKLFNKKEAFAEREDFLERISMTGGYDEIISKLTTVGERVLEEKKISYVDRVAEFLHMWKREGTGYARIVSRERVQDKDHIAIQFSCLDPSIVSREIVQGSHSTILMSGTLSPMEMHRDLLGLEEERTLLKSYISPFPKENRLNIIARGITTKYTERTPENLARIAGAVTLCVHSIRGNAAVFFPSYEMRDKICSLLKISKHAIMEKGSMTKKQRDEVKEELRRHSKDGAVLFAVIGGSFNEGVDLPGDLLNGVVVVGLPLERPTLSVEALIDYYEQRFQRGRDYGYNFPAMIKVMQAAGRCIRTEKDRGVIVFADERFLWKNYSRIFPQSWDFTVTERPETEIRKFFDNYL